MSDQVKPPGPASAAAASAPAVNGPPTGPAATAAGPATKPKPAEEHRDAYREVVETIVFVVVLVLLLKSFVAEAFVIPTGSMAETLWGIQRVVTCPECGYQFPVNCAGEIQPQRGQEPRFVVGCTCPNCRYHITWDDQHKPPPWNQGDRVLVAKYPFDGGHLGHPRRFGTTVFKYPKEPVQQQEPMNYIKRIVGLSGETLAIYNGDVYALDGMTYPGRPRPEQPKDLWLEEYTYPNDPEALAAFAAGKFHILHKNPAEMLAMRRIVYDNDHQPADLPGPEHQRWYVPAGGWQSENALKFDVTTAAGNDWQWLRYRNLLPDPNNRTGPGEKKYITNFMGYNSGDQRSTRFGDVELGGRGMDHWVGDLMLELTVQVNGNQGELVLEVSKGEERYQARFSVADGQCSLWRIGPNGPPNGTQVGVTTPTKLRPGGKYVLRFANFDDRLTLWVDGQLPFGAGQEYVPLPQEHFGEEQAQPTIANDLERPASVGARGGAAVSVSNLQLWRDTFYTNHMPPPGHPGGAETYYVQPGHYLALGDNSSESSDSRYWGAVPERLLLGRALIVYWPYNRVRLIK